MIAPNAVPPMKSTWPMLKVVNLNKYFGDFHVLKSVNLEVKRGGVVGIIGPSGSGKSTLLRCINYLEIPDEGQIWLDGKLATDYKSDTNPLKRLLRRTERGLSYYRREFGMVFQLFNLFPHLTVLENIIEAPISVRKKDRKTAIERAEMLLDSVGLLDKRDAYPSKLSGGQQQRVAIVRALAMEPKIMLFDEPTSALDIELIGEVLEVIRELANKGMTMLIVTHETAFARDVTDWIIFMDDGMIIEEGEPDQVLQNPNVERTQLFLRRILEKRDSS